MVNRSCMASVFERTLGRIPPTQYGMHVSNTWERDGPTHIRLRVIIHRSGSCRATSPRSASPRPVVGLGTHTHIPAYRHVGQGPDGAMFAPSISSISRSLQPREHRGLLVPSVRAERRDARRRTPSSSTDTSHAPHCARRRWVLAWAQMAGVRTVTYMRTRGAGSLSQAWAQYALRAGLAWWVRVCEPPLNSLFFPLDQPGFAKTNVLHPVSRLLFFSSWPPTVSGRRSVGRMRAVSRCVLPWEYPSLSTDTSLWLDSYIGVTCPQAAFSGSAMPGELNDL
jgi:hypothetical protein